MIYIMYNFVIMEKTNKSKECEKKFMFENLNSWNLILSGIAGLPSQDL